MPPNALPVAFPRPNCPSLLSSLPARKSNHPWVCRLPFTLESALVPNYSRWAFCLCFSLQPGAFVLSKRRRKKPFPRRAEHRCREVLRALNAGRCHLPASLKRYLANLISCPKNGPGSCSRSRQPCCLPACLPAAAKRGAPRKAAASWVLGNARQGAERCRTRGAVCARGFVNRALLAVLPRLLFSGVTQCWRFGVALRR